MQYKDIYFKRLNRYGLNYQERIQTEREKLFDLYLLRSTYRIDFEYEGNIYPGSFEKYQQTDSKVLHYLLTQVNVKLPGGTLLDIKGLDGIVDKWMVFWEEDMQATGYNRYVMLRMSHELFWTNPKTRETLNGFGYLWGPKDSVIQDEIMKSGKRFLFVQENETRFIIMPRDHQIKVGFYLELKEGDYSTQYRTTGYDYQSVKGVEYVSIDPIFKYDFTPPPEKQPEDKDEEFYWLNGGTTNGT